MLLEALIIGSAFSALEKGSKKSHSRSSSSGSSHKPKSSNYGIDTKQVSDRAWRKELQAVVYEQARKR